MNRLLCVVFAAALTVLPAAAQMQMGERAAGAPGVAGPLTAKYKADADRILTAAMADNDGYADLAYLCDHIGKRLSGTPQLLTAVEWGAELMRNAGLQNVKVQPVMVPKWVRGNEYGEMITTGNGAIRRRLHMLGLGMSVGTPKKASRRRCCLCRRLRRWTR